MPLTRKDLLLKWIRARILESKSVDPMFLRLTPEALLAAQAGIERYLHLVLSSSWKYDRRANRHIGVADLNAGLTERSG